MTGNVWEWTWLPCLASSGRRRRCLLRAAQTCRSPRQVPWTPRKQLNA